MYLHDNRGSKSLYVVRTPVTTEDLFIDDGGDGQTVEAVGERLPQLDVVPTLACPASNTMQ